MDFEFTTARGLEVAWANGSAAFLWYLRYEQEDVEYAIEAKFKISGYT